jgi:hypothetical protein
MQRPVPDELRKLDINEPAKRTRGRKRAAAKTSAAGSPSTDA